MRREEEIERFSKSQVGDPVGFTVLVRRYQILVYATSFQSL